MLEACRYCSMVIRPAEKRITVNLDGQKQSFHQEHYRELLGKGYREFVEKAQGMGLPPELIPSSFQSIEEGREAIGKAVSALLAGIKSEEEQIKSIAPYFKISRRYFFFKAGVPENLLPKIIQFLKEPEPVYTKVDFAKKEAKTTVAAPEPEPIIPRILIPPITPNFNPGFQANLKLGETRKVLPLLRNDLLAIIQRPFQLVFDPSVTTAATDCKEIIRFNPYPFENNQSELGFGIGYHEAGHLRHSRDLADLIRVAKEEGGEILGTIANLILDRRDDRLSAEKFPGFAMLLRKRLKYLFPGHRGRNPFEDFAYACKKGTKPRFRESYRAMKLVRKLGKKNIWTIFDVVETAEKILNILRQFIPENEAKAEEESLMVFLTAVSQIEQGPDLSPEQKTELEKAITGILKTVRNDELEKLRKALKIPAVSAISLPPIAQRKIKPPKVEKIVKSVQVAYRQVAAKIRNYINAARVSLSRIESFSEYTLHYQEKGELDLENLASLVTDRADCYQSTILEHDLDLEVHLALDTSSSMGEVIHSARQLVVLFCEAILNIAPGVEGHVWSYNSDDKGTAKIVDYGKCRPGIAFVEAAASGGNADYEALSVMSRAIQKSHHKRKIVIMVGDDGPSNPKEVNELATALFRQGVPVIHLLVEVFAAPRIFPIELLFNSFPELLSEFGGIITSICQTIR